MRYTGPMKIFLLAALCSLPFTSWAASGVLGPIQGMASVIDGDTLEIHGKRIRLHGMDAPEASQQCYINGKAWACGKTAAWELDKKIRGKTVSCEIKDMDKYGRFVADCKVAGVSVNGRQVEEGWAVAYARYSKAYIPNQERARAARRGIWSSQWASPEQYRRQNGRP